LWEVEKEMYFRLNGIGKLKLFWNEIPKRHKRRL
jgi:hypothetical protein